MDNCLSDLSLSLVAASRKFAGEPMRVFDLCARRKNKRKRRRERERELIHEYVRVRGFVDMSIRPLARSFPPTRAVEASGHLVPFAH